MKNDAARYAPQAGIGFWKSDTQFFASGRQRQWESIWSNAERTAFDVRIHSMLEAPAARWLLDGAGRDQLARSPTRSSGAPPTAYSRLAPSAWSAMAFSTSSV